MRVVLELVIVVIVAAAILLWRSRPRRKPELGFEFVYVNQDGSARETSPEERAYLSEDFDGGDSGRPYIKTSYESRDGWGSQSGFIRRRLVPASIPIVPVHPDFDRLEKQYGYDDVLALHHAAGDIVVTNEDGSITAKPNPAVSRKDAFERMRAHRLADQKCREALAKNEPA